ncbi:ribosome biogenesis protein WDR12 homolog [Tribolium castaneum]|uniref:Ribosome biogenesis protein WDR12 homolog n=1 Tax=Tribolium castaneum TaxID=7070 RepID=D6WLF3_TRICA|nr:PREDICTED: ribosome biogenesis protein WDR12 homolog [Tribolium castaneum]EFA03458.1 Ribosome biogenesis protein WDR12 homolog-like Protein [Tribolium castaneum]|eukprot:XP_966811.1 PREDICTED: ribosome biogenesis protein WDR12 homolog [Tribolium castaneum]
MESSESQLQIRLVTKQECFAVPDVPLAVPGSIEHNSLNELINQLIKENKSDFLKPKEFDFLVLGELLRVPLLEHLKEHNISTEIAIDVEYIERTPAPEPQDSLLHDDWVSGLHCVDKWILTGCYDYSVNIWTTHGKLVTSQKEHKNIVKKVAWINQTNPSQGFISVSHDLTGLLWQWEPGTDQIKPQVVLKGHEKGIDSVGVSPNCLKIATGGWDTNLKIWSSSFESDDEPAHKKVRGDKNLITRTPIHTLKGHKETITSTSWIDNHVICTVSMDHTIKFWDAELCGIKNEIVGQKAFLDSSWSSLSNTLLACSADRHIRLYDPRSSEGSVVKTTFTSHTLWVSSIEWSKYDEHLFMSGGYDSGVKLWDSRSPKAPLYNLEGHQGQVLAVDWSNNKYLVSGGCDNSVHIFRNNYVF